MITEKRYEIILNALAKKDVLTLQELMAATKCSASTIRRDLSKLQAMGKLQRVHGGATLKTTRTLEPNLNEKRTQHIKEKREIGRLAAAQICDQDRIFIDAGSTTLEMIPFIKAKDIIVVTNGLTHVEILLQHGIRTFILGGDVKATTFATVGSNALDLLRKYRFDKVFLGMNGIDLNAGLTTPDEQEALIKETAMHLGQQTFVMVDKSKYDDIHFAHVNAATNVKIITSKLAMSLQTFPQYRAQYDFMGGIV